MRVAFANLQFFICKNRTTPNLVMVIGSACLLIPELDTNILQIVLTIECRSVIDI